MLNGDYPETRIVDFLAYKYEGHYFMTMIIKLFYKQLEQTGKVSVYGLDADSAV